MTADLEASRLAVVLLVEDNDNDVVLTEEGFREARLKVNLHRVRDGVEAMAFLRRESGFESSPMPDLILLDLNLPRMDGREVLAELIADTALCRIPVVILTTSNEAEDVQSMYQLRCSSYIQKPIDFDQFLRVIRVIGEYWFTVVVLPEDSPPRGSLE